MNEAGIAWKTIANHFKVSEKELRTKRKLYYETNKSNIEWDYLCWATKASTRNHVQTWSQVSNQSSWPNPEPTPMMNVNLRLLLIGCLAIAISGCSKYPSKEQARVCSWRSLYERFVTGHQRDLRKQQLRKAIESGLLEQIKPDAKAWCSPSNGYVRYWVLSACHW